MWIFTSAAISEVAWYYTHTHPGVVGSEQPGIVHEPTNVNPHTPRGSTEDLHTAISKG